MSISLAKRVLKLALPAVGEMFLYMLIWVTDTAFMGNYGGAVAVSAVGFSSEIVYTLVNILIFLGISAGINTMVAQSIGAKEKEKAEEYLTKGLLIGLFVAILVSVFLSLYSQPLLSWAGAKGEVLEYADIYMKVVAIGAFCNMLSSMLNSGLRGIGNTVTPLLGAILVNVVHIFLAWLLVFGHWGFPSLGVKGIAIATSFSHLLGLCFLIYYYSFHSDFRPRWKYLANNFTNGLKDIANIAIPSGLQEAVFNSSRLLTVIFIMHLGNRAFAANEITTTIESVSFMPAWGFALAAITLVGQSIGAKEYKLARKYAFTATAFGLGGMTFCSLLFLTIPSLLASIFIKEPQTMALTILCLQLAALEQPFMGLAMVLEGALKGAGDARAPFVIALVSNWLIRIPLMYCVVFVWQLNVVYVWLVTAGQWIFEGMATLWLFQQKSREWSQTKKNLF